MTRVRPLAAHQIERLLAARQVVAFNADVDRSLLSGVCRRHGPPPARHRDLGGCQGPLQRLVRPVE